MTDKKPKIVRVNEEKMVDIINDIVEKTIKERNLVPAKPKTKKVTVTEAQLKELKAKGVKIISENKIS